jgi:DNA sulfur modification protein DndD
MILQNLQFENFGIYGGKQGLKLDHGIEGRPIILFGGLNGRGKTTLLDGLILCLYGSGARVSNRGSLSYSAYLKRCIHKGGATVSEASVSVRFQRAVEGETVSYFVKRAWSLKQGGIKEAVTVECNGEYSESLSKNWDHYIEGILPNRISNLFFFDSERVEELANSDDAPKLIQTAVQALLGIDLIDQLTKDVKTLERRQSAEKLKAIGASCTQNLEEELKDCLNKIALLKEKRATITNQLDTTLKYLDKAERRFKESGGDLFYQRESLEQSLVELEAEFLAVAGKLQLLASKSLPLNLISSELKEIAKIGKQEVEQNHLQWMASKLEERDAWVLDLLGETSLKAKELDLIKTELHSQREGIVSKSKNPTSQELGVNESSLQDLTQLLNHEVPKDLEELDRMCEERDKIEGEIVTIKKLLDSVPSDEDISKIVNDRKCLFQKQHQLEFEIEKIDVKIKALDAGVQRLQGQIKKEQLRILQGESDTEDISRLLLHSDRVCSTLSKFRGAILAKRISFLEDSISDSFKSLLGKSALLERVQIFGDGEFRLKVLTASGRSVPVANLSAGERQLLAISILWGLSIASGRQVPTIIDMPFGRLDSVHRKALISKYLPKASHQVILLSTDEEINGHYYDSLKPYIGGTYHLRFLEGESRTVIETGYFS